ncbi:hypothetical protein ES707_12214 [subsurface metagenome]
MHTMRMFPQVIQERGPVIIDKAMGIATGLAKTAVPVRDGTLKASIYAVRHGPLGFKLGATAPHATFVEKGTSPHIIVPKSPGGVLRFRAMGGRPQHFKRRGRWTGVRRGRGGRFTGGGNIVFAKRVHHPGTPALPFLRPAAEEAQRMIPQFTWEEVQRWLRSRGWK